MRLFKLPSFKPSSREAAGRRELYEVRLVSAHVEPGELEGVERILDRYEVGGAKVYIALKGGSIFYLVDEPRLTGEERELCSRLIYALRYTVKPTREIKEDPVGFVKRGVEEVLMREFDVREREVFKSAEERFMYYVNRDIFGYGAFDVFMRDPDIEDVSYHGPGKPVMVFHRRWNQLDWLKSNVVLEKDLDADNVILAMAHRAKAHVSAAIPIVDAMLPEKHRLSATYMHEVTPQGSSFTVRKFREEPLTVCHLIAWGALTPLMAAYLWLLLEHKFFLMVIGPTASGKTTLLNALSTLLKPNWKIVTVEDTPELRLPHEGWKPLCARHVALAGSESARTDIGLYELVKLSLRERPDYVIVGEVRGEEAYTLFQAAATGHGCMCTFHADGVESMLKRLMAPPMNVARGYIPLMNAVAVVKRLVPPDKPPVRRVIGVHEVIDADQYVQLFSYGLAEDAHRPGTVEEVGRLSRLLSMVAERAGTAEREVLNELEERRLLLQGLVEAGKLEYGDVVKEVRAYYAAKASKLWGVAL